MKRALFATIASFLLCGCSMLLTPRKTEAIHNDYTKYTESGFLVTPMEYYAEYESIGEIDIRIRPEIKENDRYSIFTRGKYYYEEVSYEELTEMAIKAAKERGADALVKFAIIRHPIKKTDRFRGGYIEGYIYQVKGFCIKRK